MDSVIVAPPLSTCLWLAVSAGHILKLLAACSCAADLRQNPSNDPEKYTDGDGFGAVLPHVPFYLGPLKMLLAAKDRK